MQQVNGEQTTTNQAVTQLANTVAQGFSQVEGQINNLSQRIDGVGAMAAANGSNLFNPADTAHDTQVGVGVGTYRGQFGYSVGAFHRFGNNMVANLKVSGATGAAGVAVGGGVNFGINLF
ncbi:hypothetical protein AQ915_20590 [Burkholderia pseudomallei]|nr:hypothetical protein AQ915_20590 [Burkholderia pseudomallei]